MNLLVDQLLSYLPDLKVPPEEIARRLTLAGVAVERVVRNPAGDLLFETDITSNRPDLLSYIGIAREAAVLFAVPLALPQALAPEGGRQADQDIAVEIEATERCSRYVARIVRGVLIGPSPPWLTRVLEASGIRPINNVVDVTNFVLLERNQPLHAFDLEGIGGARIRVRGARPAERLRTLDGVLRDLDPTDLVIADDRQALALAGIMGGSSSEIAEGTRNLLIESAFFEPRGIRRSARRHGLRTEASIRFERGADPEICERAATRAAGLIAELAGGEVSAGAVDCIATRFEGRQIKLRLPRIKRLIGMDIPRAQVLRLLAGIGLGLRDLDADNLSVEVPGHRPDLEREIDLIEEVGRLHGYNGLPSRLPLRAAIPQGRTRRQERERLLRTVLEGAGFSEAVTVSMSDAESERRFAPGIEPLRLLNPLSEALAVLRTSVLARLVESVAHNLRSGSEQVLLYELARVFRPGPGGTPVESLRLGLAAGRRRGTTQSPPADLRLLLGTAELIGSVLRLGTFSVARAAGEHAPAALGWGGRPCGEAWKPGPDLLRALELERNAELAVAEFDVEAMLDLRPPAVRYHPFSRHPAVVRDISLFVTGTTATEFLERVREALAGEPLHAEHRLVGSEHRAEDGRVALTLRVVYAAPDRTLAADEAEASHARLRELLRHDPRFALRES